MLRFLAKIAFKNSLKREENTARQKQFVSWENIQRVALLVDHEGFPEKRLVDQFIANTAKHMEVFYIETKSKESTYHDWHCFSKKDRNFLGLPNSNAFFQLENKTFDLCINTCNDTNLFAELLYAKLNATLKCGSHTTNNISDLVILKNGSQGLMNYLNEVVRYLNMIRPKHKTQ